MEEVYLFHLFMNTIHEYNSFYQTGPLSSSTSLYKTSAASNSSKLRKREDSSAGSPVHVESPQAVLPNETTPPVTYRQQSPSVWVFPPLPPQPNLYIHNAANHDALIQSDKKGLYGFKKQLSGRFKRLVSRKHHESTPVIPPELKPQLKTIYVY